MSVLAYDCPEHGWHNECDVNVAGERICPDGADIAVTGITGRTRAPDYHEDGAAITDGAITWIVRIRSSWYPVTAFDYTDALNRAIELGVYDSDQDSIREIMPKDRERRR